MKTFKIRRLTSVVIGTFVGLAMFAGIASADDGAPGFIAPGFEPVQVSVSQDPWEEYSAGYEAACVLNDSFELHQDKSLDFQNGWQECWYFRGFADFDEDREQRNDISDEISRVAYERGYATAILWQSYDLGYTDGYEGNYRSLDDNLDRENYDFGYQQGKTEAYD